MEIQQNVNVVDEDFEIPADGILGKDFLRNFGCTIDYPTMTLTVRWGNYDINWPILGGPDSDSIIIPPKCEVIRQFHIDIEDDAFVDAQEISPGIYTARAIVSGRRPLLKILNTTNLAQKISKKINAYPLREFNVIKIEPNLDEDRKKKIHEIIKRRTTKSTPGELFALCDEFSEIFMLENDKMTTNNFYSQKIRVADKTPVYIKNYRLPISHRKEIEKQVEKLIQNELIESSNSNYNSPIIIVPKKSTNGEKKYRMCIDYRQVNKKLIADKFPLPRIDEILDGLGRAKFFSVIDLFSGFHQIPIQQDSRDITSFSTPQGFFRWKVLPFGLNISPNSFTRMMNLAFAGLTPEQCFIYMDDIIVTGKSVNHHLKNLQTVFETCRKFNLKINPEKCQFFRHEVTYLGHRCTNQGVLPDSAKLATVTNYPIPHDKDATRRFVAFANYYRKFIKDFATIAKPLNHLTKKNTNFKWDANCQTSFQSLIQYLTNPPILAYPDFTQEFILTVDASAMGCGAVLSQIINNSDRPIAYASKSFNHAESKRAPIEQELTAIHWAVKHFRPYIYDTHFLIRSDHKPLVHLYSLKDPASRLTRMRLDLEEYDFTIEHVKGKKNVCADALSRISFKDLKENVTRNGQNLTVAVVTRSMSKKTDAKIVPKEQINSVTGNTNIIEAINHKEYIRVPIIRLRFRENSTGPNVIQYNAITEIFSKTNKRKPISSFSTKFHDLRQFIRKWLKCLQNEAMNLKLGKLIIEDKNEIFNYITVQQLKDLGNETLKQLIIIIRETPEMVTEKERQLQIIKHYHDDPIVGGHVGRNRLLFKIKSKYVWKNMSKDIRDFVNLCHLCQINKAKIKNIEPMKITDTPEKSLDKVIIDTIGPLPKSINNNQYVLSIIDDLTKYLVMIPIPNKEAKTVARALFDNYILVFGPMRIIVSDRGTEYVNQVTTELFNLFRITHKTSTPYRHQTVGSVERTHRVFNEYLRAYLKELNEWEVNMKYFTFCYNTTPHSTFEYQYTPFELTFGKKLQDIEILNQGKITPIYNIDNLAKEIKYRLQHAHKRATELIEKSKLRNKNNYDKNSKPIELKIGDKVILLDETRHKLQPIYKGPFLVHKIEDYNIEILDVNTSKTKIVHKDNIRKYMA